MMLRDAGHQHHVLYYGHAHAMNRGRSLYLFDVDTLMRRFRPQKFATGNKYDIVDSNAAMTRYFAVYASESIISFEAMVKFMF